MAERLLDYARPRRISPGTVRTFVLELAVCLGLWLGWIEITVFQIPILTHWIRRVAPTVSPGSRLLTAIGEVLGNWPVAGFLLMVALVVPLQRFVKSAGQERQRKHMELSHARAMVIVGAGVLAVLEAVILIIAYGVVGMD